MNRLFETLKITLLAFGLSLALTHSTTLYAAQNPADYYPTSEWRTSKPNLQQLNRKILKKLVARIRNNEITGIDSLLIVRNGYLVVEDYFNGWRMNDLHTLQSDTKSITSLLVGIAIEQGKLSGVSENVVSLFPEYARIRNLDARKETLKLEDLLTMRTGLDWSEARYEGSPLQQLNTCQCDWLKFVLDWPMLEEPGTRFEYNSGGVILLGGVLRNATGMSVDAFAQRNLFEPLGITDVRWIFGQTEGVPHTGGGLNLRPRDMAKLGYLVLRHGRWADKQVVSEEWLRESLQHKVHTSWRFSSYPVDYGYLWWLLPLDGTGLAQGEDADIYTASGAQGQWIFIIPKYDLVVVATGSSQVFDRPVGFLYSDILRAVE
jgi:CubicO group peptidase (beta-lactamase class C family)